MSGRTITRLAGAADTHLVEQDGWFFSSSVDGRDPATGDLAPDADGQITQALTNLTALLTAAGRRPAEVGLVTVGAPDVAVRPALETALATAFPDPARRPALRLSQYPLPAGQRIHLQVTGVVDQEVRVVVPGADGPVPAAVRLGEAIFTSVVEGRDRETGALVEGTAAQIRQAFDNLAADLEAAGGSWDDVVHVYAYFRDRKADQPAMHAVWQEIFPVHGQCPARKAIHCPDLEGGDVVLQLQLAAYVGQSPRRDYELGDGPGHDTGTMGASVGPLLITAGVSADPPGERGNLGDIQAQGHWTFTHLRSILDLAGGTPDNVGRVMMMIRHPEDEPVVLEYFRRLFPDPDDEPAHYVTYFQLNSQRSELVQLHVTGLL